MPRPHSRCKPLHLPFVLQVYFPCVCVWHLTCVFLWFFTSFVTTEQICGEPTDKSIFCLGWDFYHLQCLLQMELPKHSPYKHIGVVGHFMFRCIESRRQIQFRQRGRYNKGIWLTCIALFTLLSWLYKCCLCSYFLFVLSMCSSHLMFFWNRLLTCGLNANVKKEKY